MDFYSVFYCNGSSQYISIIINDLRGAGASQSSAYPSVGPEI